MKKQSYEEIALNPKYLARDTSGKEDKKLKLMKAMGAKAKLFDDITEAILQDQGFAVEPDSELYKVLRKNLAGLQPRRDQPASEAFLTGYHV
ncbi:MAG: hypothetical protein RRB13_02385 [bacterium]|nr:hypothetical protein [bacterium]